MRTPTFPRVFTRKMKSKLSELGGTRTNEAGMSRRALTVAPSFAGHHASTELWSFSRAAQMETRAEWAKMQSCSEDQSTLTVLIARRKRLRSSELGGILKRESGMSRRALTVAPSFAGHHASTELWSFSRAAQMETRAEWAKMQSCSEDQSTLTVLIAKRKRLRSSARVGIRKRESGTSYPAMMSALSIAGHHVSTVEEWLWQNRHSTKVKSNRRAIRTKAADTTSGCTSMCPTTTLSWPRISVAGGMRSRRNGTSRLSTTSLSLRGGATRPRLLQREISEGPYG
mmetsp:Transcript_9597/g.21811  ORF Transcript_9597/g.21811 Transcript_9597/m.21811 type:complete len:285 (+) Transcript_9597:102-956(+)